MRDAVRIVEVGPRDGLQNEATPLSPGVRVELIKRLLSAGLTNVEVGSFVSPKWVPQMAGTDIVLRSLDPDGGNNFPVLVPNLQGLEAAQTAGAREVAVFLAASETFSRKNINCSIAESIERTRPVTEQALASGMRLRGYVSCVLGCPYEGGIPITSVVDVVGKLSELGCHEISLGDTIGVGTSGKARELVRAVATVTPIENIAVHFHDTYGQALANIYASLLEGVRTVDASVGGLGGCPYAKGASGNVATETVVTMLDGLDIETGVDIELLLDATAFIHRALDREISSSVYKARRG